MPAKVLRPDFRAAHERLEHERGCWECRRVGSERDIPVAWWQDFLTKFFTVRLGKFSLDGWKGHEVFYAGRCPLHGRYVAYRMGHRAGIPCPQCVRTDYAA